MQMNLDQLSCDNHLEITLSTRHPHSTRTSPLSHPSQPQHTKQTHRVGIMFPADAEQIGHYLSNFNIKFV